MVTHTRPGRFRGQGKARHAYRRIGSPTWTSVLLVTTGGHGAVDLRGAIGDAAKRPQEHKRSQGNSMIVWRGRILANILSALQPLGGKILTLAGVAELVDAPDSKSGHFGGVGSIPSTPTK